MTMAVSDDIESVLDLPVGLLISALFAGVILIGLHTWLSRRSPVWLGAIVPVAYLAISVSLSLASPPSAGGVAGHVIAVVGLLAIWWAGEGSRQRGRHESGAPHPE